MEVRGLVYLEKMEMHDALKATHPELYRELQARGRPGGTDWWVCNPTEYAEILVKLKLAHPTAEERARRQMAVRRPLTAEGRTLWRASYRARQSHPAGSKPISIPQPTLADLAANFSAATTRWVAAGFPVVSSEVHAARMAVCKDCEFWDGGARLGLGKCKQPSCHCTRFKHWLATEKCPLAKWNL